TAMPTKCDAAAGETKILIAWCAASTSDAYVPGSSRKTLQALPATHAFFDTAVTIAPETHENCGVLALAVQMSGRVVVVARSGLLSHVGQGIGASASSSESAAVSVAASAT